MKAVGPRCQRGRVGPYRDRLVDLSHAFSPRLADQIKNRALAHCQNAFSGRSGDSKMGMD